MTVFLSILNQLEFYLVQNRKGYYHHDHILFNLKGTGNIVLLSIHLLVPKFTCKHLFLILLISCLFIHRYSNYYGSCVHDSSRRPPKIFRPPAKLHYTYHCRMYVIESKFWSQFRVSLNSFNVLNTCFRHLLASFYIMPFTECKNCIWNDFYESFWRTSYFFQSIRYPDS